MQARPADLSFFAQAGVLDRILKHQTGPAALRERIEQGVVWGDTPAPGGPTEIKILDSFFSDTVSDDLIRSLIQRAMDGQRLRFLLADPAGQFGSSRAKSIDQDAEYESLQGLLHIAKACRFVRKAAGHNVPSELALTKAQGLQEIRDMLQKLIDGINVEVRFYDVGPSGPLYFFGDILVAGRFSAGVSAAELPWDMIIWSSTVKGDLFDLLADEFEYVWNHGVSLANVGIASARAASKTPTAFISYCAADSAVAREIAARLTEGGVIPYLFENRLELGSIWSEGLRKELREVKELIVIISERAKQSSDWIRVEVGAAWVMGATITPATIGCECDILPGLLDQRQHLDISTEENKAELVKQIIARCGAGAPK